MLIVLRALAFVEVLAVGMRVGVLNIVFNMTADLLKPALTDIIRGVLTITGIGILVDINIEVFTEVISAFMLAMTGP